MNTKQHIGLLLLRISIAFTMLIYGISKLNFGIEYINGLLEQYGLPTFLGYGVFVGEFIAPILIIIGYRTKLAGLAFAINCFVAILMDRLPDVLSLNDHGGWSIGLIFIYMMFGIAMFFMGAGKYALSTNNKWD
ncbi:GntR family transcriptional regulator [Yeosuana aromativorans]|uniref:GntR family transcriptional regulator n=1 Tax=Yeosuana aromativorans TaxID=288019 RepID=A0A8J3BPR6_9FLAO|nr:DoxX family protein [Yeosuana aromativorans]GGK34253.1 GntR family transcriptional regulator [Yeosuana aromativorans]